MEVAGIITLYVSLPVFGAGSTKLKAQPLSFLAYARKFQLLAGIEYSTSSMTDT